jgi:hypothetical protein
MNVRELVPLIKYQRIRLPSTSDQKWDEQMRMNQEQQILAVALRHDLGDDVRWASACVVIHHYRDFCGGIQVESGSVNTAMHPDFTYTSKRIVGGREPMDINVLPHINDLVADPPRTLSGLQLLLEKSVCGAIASYALGCSRSMIHFVDKDEGQLTQIMRHFSEIDTLENVPVGPVSTNHSGKLQPFLRQSRPEFGEVPDHQMANVRLHETATEINEVSVVYMQSDMFHNNNSGNSVYGGIVNIGREELGGHHSAYCHSCEEHYDFEGFTDCPECGDEIFDQSLTGRTARPRPEATMNALREKMRLVGAWRFMPHELWRCG